MREHPMGHQVMRGWREHGKEPRMTKGRPNSRRIEGGAVERMFEGGEIISGLLKWAEGVK